MRLIDADKLKEEIGECPENWLDTPEEMQAVDDWKNVMELIDAAPTIAVTPNRDYLIVCPKCETVINVINIRKYRGYCGQTVKWE